MLQQKRRLEAKIQREQTIISDLSPLAMAILDLARAHGRVTNREIVKEAKASPNTVKATLGKLVESGLLVRDGAGRSTWYRLP